MLNLEKANAAATQAAEFVENRLLSLAVDQYETAIEFAEPENVDVYKAQIRTLKRLQIVNECNNALEDGGTISDVIGEILIRQLRNIAADNPAKLEVKPPIPINKKDSPPASSTPWLLSPISGAYTSIRNTLGRTSSKGVRMDGALVGINYGLGTKYVRVLILIVSGTAACDLHHYAAPLMCYADKQPAVAWLNAIQGISSQDSQAFVDAFYNYTLGGFDSI